MQKNTQIIVTLGPLTKTEEDLLKIRERGVDFVRINMSHSTVDDLKFYLALAKRVGISFIIDTQGSQIRTGPVENGTICFRENARVKLSAGPVVGNSQQLSFHPAFIVRDLEDGDLIHVDFDTLILRVSDTSTLADGYIMATAITGGFIGSNKAVVIDPNLDRRFALPPLSSVDYQSIELGLQEGVEHVAVSFVRSGDTVDQVRDITRSRMQIISKIECTDALEQIDAIIEKSDALLIDRGDLSKEIPVERIPLTQRIILGKAAERGTRVFVATNLLETMVEKRKPTRAEVHDVINTILDGAGGLTLSAETAIGRHPIACINMLNRLIRHAEGVVAGLSPKDRLCAADPLTERLKASGYLLDYDGPRMLIPPHGGKLVHRVLRDPPGKSYLNALQKVPIDSNTQRDVQQLAIGAYSPLEGFLGKDDLESVLNEMRLADGTVWPIPVVLDVTQETADRLSPGEEVGLADMQGELVALLHLSEKYRIDSREAAEKVYGTSCPDHPGVRMMMRLRPVLLAGKINLIKRMASDTKAYELTPRQLRRLFEERGWASVLGFHTRTVIHRGHEFVQLEAIAQEHCDGLLVHPVIGQKPGDFQSAFIIKTYERMIQDFYPVNRVVFATFNTFSRYAGPREALFTALCRQNFGCSHFVVGPSHTGVGDYYEPTASQTIFDQFPEVEIKTVPFNEVYYSPRQSRCVVQQDDQPADLEDGLSISGSKAREMFQRGEMPPSWFMRPEISQIILDAIRDGEQVFVTEEAMPV